jgi:hypothetical protein
MGQDQTIEGLVGCGTEFAMWPVTKEESPKHCNLGGRHSKIGIHEGLE